jgi:hypothetical protein
MVQSACQTIVRKVVAQQLFGVLQARFFSFRNSFDVHCITMVKLNNVGNKARPAGSYVLGGVEVAKLTAKLAALVLVASSVCCHAAEDVSTAKVSDVHLNSLVSAVRKVVEKYYPGAVVEMKDGRIHFESNTRKIMVRESDMTGKLQEPREEVVPKEDGVCCDAVLQSGKYGGQAIVPQKIKKSSPDYSVLLLAPYSEGLDQHFSVVLKHGERVSSEFTKEFTELVNRFEQHLTQTERTLCP